MTLFRPEAVEGQRRQLHGVVMIHQPVSHIFLTCLLGLGTTASVILAATAQFTKREDATGWIVPERGMAETFVPPGAVVEQVYVTVGEPVKPGQPLASFTTETYATSGPVAENERRQVLNQIQETDAQIKASRQRQLSASSISARQISSISQITDNIKEQRALQNEQLKLAISQYNAATPLLEKGFVSRFAQDRRKQDLLSIRQNVVALDRQLKEQEAQMLDIQKGVSSGAAQQISDEAQLRGAKASLSATVAGLDYRLGSSIRSPIAGVVAAVNIRVGETTRTGLPIVSIAPKGPLAAEILLPTKNAAFVKAGQIVRISIDAFPFQHYGSIEGIVQQVGNSAVSPNEYAAPIKFEQASYRIRVSIGKQQILAYGANNQLRPGMTLSASIITDRRTFLNWLLDPILATRRSMTE